MIAVRGAVRVPRNDRDAILRHTQRLLEAIRERNGFEPGRVVSAFFTMTPDLNADFPAYAARAMGWDGVPMLGAQETPVPGAPDRMVRVLLHVDAPGPPHHVYLGEAASMRPDLAADTRGPAEAAEADPRATEPGADPRATELGAVLVVGLGLIGGSLALALRRSSRFGPVLGADRDPRALELARASGAVDAADASPELYLDRASTLILALPVPAIVEWLQRWGPRLSRGTVVLDVGSVKAPVIRAMAALPEGVEAIGTHPMAGSEETGMGAARPDLFYDAAWALVETARTGARSRALAAAVVEAAGGRPLFTDAEMHDRAVAASSHLPYVLAGALTRSVTSGEAGVTALAGPGLRDMTRLAASPPDLMAGILAANWPRLQEALARYREELDGLMTELAEAASGDEQAARDAIRGILEDFRSRRGALSGDLIRPRPSAESR